jgi:hypothetical protein
VTSIPSIKMYAQSAEALYQILNPQNIVLRINMGCTEEKQSAHTLIHKCCKIRIKKEAKATDFMSVAIDILLFLVQLNWNPEVLPWTGECRLAMIYIIPPQES